MNSAVWNPGGKFWWVVSLTTRGPAKPIMHFGSARLMSPIVANDAVTPPVVGWVSREMKGSFASESRAKAPQVLAICISESIPSCMRAPDEAETMIMPRFSAMAISMARVIFSPTTEPIDPAKNLKSITAIIARLPSMLRRPQTTASLSPVLARRAAVFSA